MDDYLENEYRPVFAAWKEAPSPKTSGALLQAVQPVLATALRSYGGAKPAPTLNSRAKLMALEAFSNYDPRRAKLRTHLLSHLRGLQRHAARANQLIRLPERAALDLGRVHHGRIELSDQLGRAPSLGELADHLGTPVRRLARLDRVRPGILEGQTISTTTEENTLPPAVISPKHQEAWLDFVYLDLLPTDQVIFDHALGRHGQPRLPKSEIARKLGISAGAVSQRLSRLQEKIDYQEHTQGVF